jgi:hypothetical protein
METKIGSLLMCFLFLIWGFIKNESEKITHTKSNKLKYCQNDSLCYYAEIYLDSLKKSNKKEFIKTIKDKDSLGVEVFKTQFKLKNTTEKLHKTENLLYKKPKEIVVERIIKDTVFIKEKKNFWGTTKFDTIQ